jgi:hypothetical protein
MKRTTSECEILENRPLSDEERLLLEWLLQNGNASARSFLVQLEAARVVSRCGCGCASINLSVGDGGWNTGTSMQILSDYGWQDVADRKYGILVFEKSGFLAGLEVWSVDGEATPATLPSIHELRPL